MIEKTPAADVLGRPQQWTNAAMGVAYLLGALTAVLIAAAACLLYRGITPSTGPVLFQDFATLPDGPVSVADSGQPWIESTNGAPGAELRVIDGKLTNSAVSTGPASGYISADLPEAVSKITAQFGFGQGATDNGSAAILVGVAAPLGDTATSNLTSPCHVVITPAKIDFSVANNGRIASVGSDTFAQRLSVDTQYHIAIEINYLEGVARIEGPDGKTRVFSDSRITTNRGSIVTYQVFQQSAASDDRSYFEQIRAW
jgi:hypothetical protein